jgi:hypothetical protein
MAKIVLTDAVVTVNSVVLSEYSNSVTLTYEVDSVETTGMSNTAHQFTGGLQNNSLEVAFMQDFAATKVEATLFPLVGTQTTVKVKPASGNVSATNPEYTLTNCFLASHTPVAGSVGELAMTTVTFTGGALTKGTGA